MAVLKAHAIRLGGAMVPSTPEQEHRRNDELARLERALHEAYESGLGDGRAHADLEAARLVEASTAALTRSLNELTDARVRRRAADEHDLLHAAALLARWMLGRELELDPTAIVPRLEAMTARLPGDGPVRISVGPAVHAALGGWAEREGVELEPDASLSPGEAHVHGEHGSAALTLVDAVGALLDELGLDVEAADV